MNKKNGSKACYINMDVNICIGFFDVGSLLLFLSIVSLCIFISFSMRPISLCLVFLHWQIHVTVVMKVFTEVSLLCYLLIETLHC